MKNPFRLQSSSFLWSERAFRRLLESERDLADRQATPCALLVLDTSSLARRERRSFVDFLEGRVRVSDGVGTFRGDLAILLRNTPPAGARTFTEDIGTYLATHRLEIGHQLLCYPTDYVAPGPRGLVGTREDLSSKPSLGRRREDGVALSTSVDEPELGVSRFEACLVRDLHPLRRIIDVVASAGALLMLAPALAAVALAIRVEGPGPVLYRQRRVGAGGRIFDFLKFRSMSIDAEASQAALEAANEKDGPIFKIKDDPRVTRVGRFIRRYSLDELPQLVNVLRGDMTLVGPRPQKPDEVAQYEPWQRRRLALPGGLTCTWQVSGRSDVSFDEWMRMDCGYARSQSLWSDLALIARTVPALVSAKGAY